MKNLNRIVLIGATCAAFHQVAGAVTITTAQGNGADTYLSNDERDESYVAHGTSPSMEFRHMDGARFRALYFRFDLSAYKEETLSNAAVTLYGIDVGRNRELPVMGLLDAATSGQGENWNEATLGYHEAAGFSAAPLGTFALSGDLTAELARTAGSANGANTTGASNQLDAFLNADTDGLVTFVVYTTDPLNGTEDFQFETKESDGGHAPTLTFSIAKPISLGFVL